MTCPNYLIDQYHVIDVTKNIGQQTIDQYVADWYEREWFDADHEGYSDHHSELLWWNGKLYSATWVAEIGYNKNHGTYYVEGIESSSVKVIDISNYPERTKVEVSFKVVVSLDVTPDFEEIAANELQRALGMQLDRPYVISRLGRQYVDE